MAGCNSTPSNTNDVTLSDTLSQSEIAPSIPVLPSLDTIILGYWYGMTKSQKLKHDKFLFRQGKIHYDGNSVLYTLPRYRENRQNVKRDYRDFELTFKFYDGQLWQVTATNDNSGLFGYSVGYIDLFNYLTIEYGEPSDLREKTEERLFPSNWTDTKKATWMFSGQRDIILTHNHSYPSKYYRKNWPSELQDLTQHYYTSLRYIDRAVVYKMDSIKIHQHNSFLKKDSLSSADF